MRLRLPVARTIRSRLLLSFVGVVALTAASISAVTVVIQSRDARDRVVAQLESVATLKGQQVDSWTEGLSVNLDVALSGEDTTTDLHTLIAGEPGTEDYDHAHARVLTRFIRVSKQMSFFEELFFMDREGKVLVSTDRSHERQQLGMNDYFTQGTLGRFVQEPSYTLALDKMTVVASRPVADEDVAVGVLAGRANLDSLNDVMVGRTGLGETGETYLVGSNHRLLTDLRHPGFEIPNAYVRTAGADAAADRNESGFATYEGYAGERVIGVYAWIPGLKVALLAEQEEAEALGATRLSLWTTVGIALAATVLAIVAGSILIHSIVRPLSELGETAERIAAGDLELTADVGRRDEIGRLAQSFNQMTGRLRGLVYSLERRTDHLRAVNEAGRQISSVLDIDELSPDVARSLLAVFDYECIRVLLLHGEGGGRLLSCSETWDEAREVTLDQLDDLPAMMDVARSGEPVLHAGTAGDGGAAGGRSELAVPLRVGGVVAGVLGVTSGSARPLDEHDLFTATALADQLAIAVQNTRLYHSARELAASKERQRLARDLHDAVSQTLFSVSLMAEVLPQVYARDPEQGRRRLEELRQLTRGALAEMRMLLLELRPAALADTSLPDLLRQLTEAVVARARIPIELHVETSCEIPPEVSVALYRIAQEALNNVAKHAGAGQARVILRDWAVDQGEALELVVEDDGCGFDSKDAGSGRLGLTIMAERAESVGARLELDTAPDEGTRVRVVWRAGALGGPVTQR